eukprot:CAMPEP_0115531310 /NCGR_PEP_ID=MMETSP0271-20121206/84970_1 /TAXON_ID=71861 /ORGANISM="Scrippsiella trochoidea, Strain CCMP3099" /LENGTH=455 /DNA_ID=CAMNT_0002963517 /DNA_START=47 /DNA_END=1410 /DNA_ORIENTATION=+
MLFAQQLCGFALTALAHRASSHSWVACTDYRGDVNYFEQDMCLAWPRQWSNRGEHAEPQANGYHIAEEPPSRAWSGLGCDVAMASPSWQDGYSELFPFAVYEPGRVYCLAWPMKNHGIMPAGCTNPHSKSDEGLDESLTLRVSGVNPTRDPSQAEFNLRNINELAGLASNCSHTWSELGQNSNGELRDECQLGLEKHRTGHPDCKGFTRAPKFCESSGAAMGTGCFKVPLDMSPGHYVAQWYWDASFSRSSGLQNFAYTSCFDFEVVPLGSSAARLGDTGTVGTPDSTLPCQNNALKVSGAASATAPTTTAPSSVTPALGTSAPTPDSIPVEDGTGDAPAPTTPPGAACAGAHEICADPSWDSPPICCEDGYLCEFANEHWASCRPLPSATPVPAPRPISEPASTPSPQDAVAPTPLPGVSCVGAYEICADPSWDSSPVCCEDGYLCEFANEHWA